MFCINLIHLFQVRYIGYSRLNGPVISGKFLVKNQINWFIVFNSNYMRWLNEVSLLADKLVTQSQMGLFTKTAIPKEKNKHYQVQTLPYIHIDGLIFILNR